MCQVEIETHSSCIIQTLIEERPTLSSNFGERRFFVRQVDNACCELRPSVIEVVGTAQTELQVAINRSDTTGRGDAA